MTKWIRLAFGLLCIAMITAGAEAKPPRKVLLIHEVPRTVGALSFVDEAGAPRSIEDFRGRHVLVNLWATWCLPCRKEMPSLDRLQERLGGERFQVLPLSVDRRGAEAVREFYRRNGVRHLPVFVGKGSETAKAFASKELPTTVLLDPAGREIARYIGDAEWDSHRFVAYLTQVLSSAPLAKGDCAAPAAGTDLTHCDFTNAKLAGADLSGADLGGVRIVGADLRNARLVGTKLDEAVLYHVRMDYADLSGASLAGATLANVKMKGVTASGAGFSGATIRRGNLEFATLTGADFSNAVIVRGRLTGSRLDGARLIRSELAAIVAEGTDFSRADFTGATIFGGSLIDAKLQGAVFTDADFSNVAIDGADFSGATGLPDAVASALR